MDDFEAVESRTAWKVGLELSWGARGGYLSSEMRLTAQGQSSQAVNAAHEFKICVRPQEEDLKELVHVKIHFK